MVKDVDITWMNAPTNTDPPEYDAADLRRADAALLAGAGSLPLGVRGGIALHSADSLAVTVDGADQVTIQPGAFIIAGDAVTGTGCYRGALPTAHSEPLTARNATSGRIDLVVVRALDVDVVGTHTQRLGRLQIIPGTPSATPGVPAKPSMAIEVGRINVPSSAGGAATVDSSYRMFAAALGGELLVATAARLPATASPWQRGRALDTGRAYEFDGDGWQPIPQVQRGVVMLPVPSLDTDLTAHVTFGRTFINAPHVVVSPETGGNPQNTLAAVKVGTITTTGFDITYRRLAGGAFPCRWIAVD